MIFSNTCINIKTVNLQNPRVSMKNKILALLLYLPLLTGCAQIAVKNAQEQMTIKFDSLMGNAEENVILSVGAPQSIDNIGELKIYHYFQSYGMRTNAFANAQNGSAFGAGNAWESYDKVDVIFKNGKAISWKGYVQR